MAETRLEPPTPKSNVQRARDSSIIQYMDQNALENRNLRCAIFSTPVQTSGKFRRAL